MKLTVEQTEFIEKVGRWWESVAGSRTGGRILGWLMICDPDHQSSAQMVHLLDVSAGSVSTQVRRLEQVQLVETVTFPGDRARYYRLPERVWSRVMQSELDQITRMRQLAESGAAVLPQSRPERVTELKAVAEFFELEWPSLLDRFSAHPGVDPESTGDNR